MAVERFLASAIAHFEPADLIGALATGIVVLDSDLCVVYANVAAQDLLAVSVNQARGKPFLSLVLEADSLSHPMRRALDTGETLSERELAVMAGPLGRERRVIDITMTPLDSEFERKYLLLEISDATQRQRITRENELISRLDSSRQMVRQLAHEIKNPLGGLRGAAQLLERELHEHLREYTGVIISEADRLTALVDSMIGPARAPQKALINVHELCEHVYRLLRSEARGGVLVERDYDPSLPNAEVDANQIIQALLNIGRNALLAVGERGRIVIRTRIAANVNIGTTRHKLAASLQVEDNGPGVPPEIADTIFFPLVTGRANGTGLGLAVSQDLVTRHGGLIEFESKPGRTVFTILLPLPGERMSVDPTYMHNATPSSANQPALRVWLVEDDASIRWVLERALRASGMVPRAFDAAEPALAALRSDVPDVLLTDIRMPGSSGIDLLREVRAAHPALPVIVMTAHSDLPSAVSAYEGGAFEYLPKPFDIDQAVELVRRAGQTARRGDEAPAQTPEIPELLGKAPAMQQVFRAIGRLSRSSVAVLITGESGTGKELVARALHEHSPRQAKPFVALNTSAIPAELLESELFGHEKGSFTGADTQRRGRFEQANGGTLFLDEIGDMSTPLQTRLLRVLAEGEFYRVGGQTPVKVDVRVIAATHQNLEERVERGIFREDLYHRLNVIRIELPPLRSRTEDVPDLLGHYLRQAAAELGTETKTLAPITLERLQSYRWPGNVRELVNLCRRLTALAPGSEIQLQDLPSEMHIVTPAAQTDWAAALTLWAKAQPYDGTVAWLDQALPEFERVLIRVALNRTHGHRQEAARVLGWGRNTLTRKLKELGMADDESLP